MCTLTRAPHNVHAYFHDAQCRFPYLINDCFIRTAYRKIDVFAMFYFILTSTYHSAITM